MRDRDAGERDSMEISWAACCLVTVLTGGCYSSGASTDDEPEGGADDVSVDDPGADGGPDSDGALPEADVLPDSRDADGRDAGDDGDGADAASVTTSAWLQIAGDYSPFGSWAWLCRCEGLMPPPAEVWAEEAGCKLTHDPYGEPPDPTTCRPLDFGELTLSIAGGTYTLEPYGEASTCAFTFQPALPSIPVGDVVRLSSTGGADLPPFDVDLTMPPQVALTEPAADSVWVPGEPWTLRWDPALEIHALLRMPGRHLYLQCEATTLPPLVVPSTITALWDEFDVTGSLNFLAVRSTVVGSDPRLTIELGWGEMRPVLFAPAP